MFPKHLKHLCAAAAAAAASNVRCVSVCVFVEILNDIMHAHSEMPQRSSIMTCSKRVRARCAFEGAKTLHNDDCAPGAFVGRRCRRRRCVAFAAAHIEIFRDRSRVVVTCWTIALQPSSVYFSGLHSPCATARATACVVQHK